MTFPREPRIHPVSIAALRPTQITVGMREVMAKRKSWRAHPQRKRADFLGRHLIPVIWGPKEEYYVIDHHHLTLALHHEGVRNIATTVVADLRRLPRDAFWVYLDNRGWLRLGAHDFVSIARFPQAALMPGVLVLRPEEPLFFANAEPLLALARREVSKQPDVRLVVLSLEESPDLDGTALESLGEFAAWLAAHKIKLRMARLKDAARDALMRADFSQLPASELDYSSVDDAVSGRPAGAFASAPV